VALDVNKLGRQVGDSVYDNWLDSGHSRDREHMDRGYAHAAVESMAQAHLEGVLDRYAEEWDTISNAVEQAALDYLGDIVAPEAPPPAKKGRKRRSSEGVETPRVVSAAPWETLFGGCSVGSQATAPRCAQLGSERALYGGPVIPGGSRRAYRPTTVLGSPDLGRRFRAGWTKPPFWQLSPTDGVTIERLYDPDDEPIEIARYTAQLKGDSHAASNHSGHTDRA
jgi:hypothetical protein